MTFEKFRWFSFFTFFIFLIDRISKWAIVNLSAESFFIIPRVLEVKLFENPGIAFSILIPYPYLYFLIAAILLILNFLMIKSYRERKYLLTFYYILIIVGAISNLIDRIVFGSVIDYLSIFTLPVFNLADLMIISGVILIMPKRIKRKNRFG